MENTENNPSPDSKVSSWDCCPACGGSGHYGDAARRSIDGEIPAAKTILGGSVVVPIEPTPEMLERGVGSVCSLTQHGARAVYQSMIRPTDDDRVSLARDYVQQNFASGEPWSMTIARAILEERVRCAAVADYHAECSLHASHSEDDGSYYACGAIAEDIRNPKSALAPSQLIADDEQPF